MGQFPEYVPTAATNDCVWNSNENIGTSSQKHRHLPRNVEEVTHSDDAPMFTVIMAPPRISKFGYPNIWHTCNIQSRMCDHGIYIYILLKSIQKSAPSSNSSMKAALNNAVGNGEHRCVLACPSPKEFDNNPLNIMTHYVQDTKIATWHSFLEI